MAVLQPGADVTRFGILRVGSSFSSNQVPHRGECSDSRLLPRRAGLFCISEQRPLAERTR